MKTTAAFISLATVGQAFIIPAAEADIVLQTTESSACDDVTCVPSSGGAHIIVSRASTEAPGTGVIGSVADAVVSACPSSDVAANPCKQKKTPLSVDKMSPKPHERKKKKKKGRTILSMIPSSD